MADRHDYVALEWLKGEIAETLRQARNELDAFIEDPANSAAMAECLNLVHQVHGSLQMIEFYGAALLAEEIEQLALAVQQNRVSHPVESEQLLIQAMSQLPVYLERIHSARRDLPLVVLPLLNDLRSARGESLLSETSLFAPQLVVVPALDDQELARRNTPELPNLLRKLRQTLQAALAGLMREQGVQTQLGYMAKVFARLEQLCEDAPLGPLWRIASALVETMLNGNFTNSPALRSLLKDADKELKRLAEQGVTGINQPAPEELLKSLLFYIAKSDSLAPKMLDLKDQYALADALPGNDVVNEERARMAGPDRDAMRSVIVALCEGLVRVKERLDVFVRGDRQHVSELNALPPPLRQIADTLAVLGFGQPRKVIIDQLSVVLGLAQGQREPSDGALMDVAGALLYVESTLAGMAGSNEQASREESRLPTTDLTQIHQLVIREARTVLQQAKDVILDYIDGEWDRQRLDPLCALIVQVRGALAMIPLARAASLLAACNEYIQEHLLVDETRPSWVQLDCLADTITGIEYYLERMLEDHEAPGDQVLDMAQQSLARLGYTPAADTLEVPLLEEIITQDELLELDDRKALVSPAQTIAQVLASPVSAVNPPARNVPTSLLPPSADEEAVDDELREVFLEEADEVLDALREYLPRWFASLGSGGHWDSTALTEVRRAFHTLKGSGRMVRALILSELAWSVENLLNRVLEGDVLAGLEVQQLMSEVLTLLPSVIRDFAEDAQRQRNDVDLLAARAHALANGLELPALPATGESVPVEALDPQLLEIFRQEALGHLNTLGRFLDNAEQSASPSISDAVLRALHTLKGSAHMAGVLPIAELASPLDQLVREYKANLIDIGAPELALLRSAEPLLHDGLKQLDTTPLAAIAGAAELIEAALALLNERLTVVLRESDSGLRIKRNPTLLAGFLAEGMDIVLDAENLLRRWRQHPGERQELSALLDELTTLGHGAHLADLPQVDELCEALLDLYGAVEESSLAVSERFFDAAENAHEALINMLDQVAAGQDVEPRPECVRALNQLLDQALDPSATGLVKSDGHRTLSVTELNAATEQLASEAEHAETAGPDDEIVEIFLEEAVDILDSAGQALQRWLADPENSAPLASLQRDLHTLKGGARMVEIAPIGDLAHELETLYEGLSAGNLQPAPLTISLLQSGHDVLADMLDAVRNEKPLPDASLLIESIRRLASDEPVGEPVVAQTFETGPESVVAVAPAADGEVERSGPEMVKVPAEQLEDLVNLAGETSIFRGRIEQQILDSQVALLEVETTIERMRDQLRRLDMETQGRILSREQVQAERLGYEEFDPLEMDRHSQLQQLSRALFESASDLMDLKETLGARARDAETLLSQQARVNTQLQEGLMRTRMVPFERLVPRLRRLVRQVASELHKKVHFEVGNADGEMDRNVLERMVAPLEHMLRNAVDHGLESTEKRIAAGKPEQGHISLELMYEGGDMVIELSDDGSGVDLAAVRRKAIKRGMIHPDADLSDHEVLPFILQAGFSTSEIITQISGRGVGMDVVHAEVKQLGGSMVIDSVPGKGTRFRIRLPISVSVNRALMVTCGEEQYAVPLNTVDGIVRVMANELDGYYQTSPPRYQYGGRSYELRYLGELLGSSPPRLAGQLQPLPVLLVHLQDQWVAVQVDALAGSREIVVKSLGTQFSRVQGISGATILGDGRVVLILDLMAQIRTLQGLPFRGLAPVYHEAEHARPLLVMVVDDSVTVRKVTSRLLERHGMHVLTAKDGIDAMTLLQEHTPDIMLLDIEMPRMDGFEVASQIRQDEQLKELPIIMITSRSGQKHRDRAMAVGVNEYLSKPYQETVLLESIAYWSQVHV
ncbi:Hpt domain-containing protein [Pseudomonas savastanoi]|uniref:Hpt domain-containing protein n=1 Tax=Pseudomonas savastanoi TaxID=29438 RepID=UPI000E3145AE|nr:Hpt domain-containing protein [Pseudomonas savastanoi]